MTITEFMLKINGKFSFIRKFSQRQMRLIILNNWSRKKMNNFYNSMSYYEKSIFHALFSRIFRTGGPFQINGHWVIKFADKEIKMPLAGETLWLDWDSAISIIGNDVEIKKYYEESILSDTPPNCFFDIGANYGTHSLLFLSCGIKTFSFEPNPNCQSQFERLTSYNGLKGNWYPIALGESSGMGNLVFPEKETWLGSLEVNIQKELNRYGQLASYQVQILSLDELILKTGVTPDLIKIDTEGFELQVLLGAKEFLLKESPIILFESQVKDRQADLFKHFIQMNYNIKILKNNLDCSINEFLETKETNFIGIN